MKLLRLRAFLKVCSFCTTDANLLKLQALVKDLAAAAATRSQELANREDVREFRSKWEEVMQTVHEHGSNALKHESFEKVTKQFNQNMNALTPHGQRVVGQAASALGKKLNSAWKESELAESSDVDEDTMGLLVRYIEWLPQKLVEFGVGYARVLNAYLKDLAEVGQIDGHSLSVGLYVFCCAGVLFCFGRFMCGGGCRSFYFAMLFASAAVAHYQYEEIRNRRCSQSGSGAAWRCSATLSLRWSSHMPRSSLRRYLTIIFTNG